MISADSILQFVDDVVCKFRPERVVLFGSYAYGNPTADSDVDVLVVMPYRGRSQPAATRIRLAVDAPFPMDLLVRSPAEMKRRIAQNDFFLEEVRDKGLVLYAKDDSRVGAQGRRRLGRRHAPASLAKA
jgi:predicted nucleotidyltransferase